MKIDNYYQTERYKKEFLLLRRKVYQEKGKLIVNLISNYNHKRVLDIGCGDGGLGLFIKNAMNNKVHGVDISKKGVNFANKVGIISKVSDVQKNIPFDKYFFDVAIANELIEHLYDPDSFIKEVKKVLKKNGIFIIGTPNLSFWFNRLLFLFGIYPLYLEGSIEHRRLGMGFLTKQVINQPVGHVRVFNLAAVKDFLKIYDFEILAIKGISVPFESSNKIINFSYKIIDKLFGFFPSLSSDLLILAKSK